MAENGISNPSKHFLLRTNIHQSQSVYSMDTDPTFTWVLDYFLRQPLEERILDSLVRSLPLPNQPNVKKLIILKRLESEISRHRITEHTLDLLEHMEEIEFRLGNEAVSGAMKSAYCLAAVDCVVNILRGGGYRDKNKSFEFFEAVKRVWRGRIQRMKEVVKKGGLGSEQLWEWKEKLEAAVWDDDIANNVVNCCQRCNVIEALNVYISEERKNMGPSFLDWVAETMKNDVDLQRIMEVNGAADDVAEMP